MWAWLVGALRTIADAVVQGLANGLANKMMMIFA